MRRSTNHVESKISEIPMSIMNRYRDVIVGGDIMFVNKIPFFVTVSRGIKFGTAEMLQTQLTKTILSAIKQVKGLYMKLLGHHYSSN